MFEVQHEGKGKTGEVNIEFDGMEVNMTRFPRRNVSRNSQAQANGEYSLCCVFMCVLCQGLVMSLLFCVRPSTIPGV